MLILQLVRSFQLFVILSCVVRRNGDSSGKATHTAAITCTSNLHGMYVSTKYILIFDYELLEMSLMMLLRLQNVIRSKARDENIAMNDGECGLFEYTLLESFILLSTTDLKRMI
jgi:hypothetical protein